MLKDASLRRSVVNRLHTRATRLLVPVALALAGVDGAAAQVNQGCVTGPDDRPVPDALVKLIGPDGVQHAYHLTTGDGRYSLVFPVDLTMTPGPIRIAGIDVSVDRVERVARSGSVPG